jgi:NAD(P)-dependent dehydrogenase (short-subunit alcohol dehydrogenase family)
MEVTLKDKVALVTGAGAGIGKGIADAFASLSAKIVVAELNEKHCDALRTQYAKDGTESLVVKTDVCDIDQVNALAAEIDKKFGKLDILVNNVGHHLKLRKTLEQSTPEEWQALYDINLRHMFIVTRAVLPLMKRSGKGGSIINVSSIEGFRGYPGNIIYTTFKHAVTGFTRGLAIELSTDKIRVNVIAPEFTDSEQVPVEKLILPEHFKQAEGTIPLGRFGRPEDSAWAAVYLASDWSSWVTGTEMLVDGGGLCGNVFQRTPEGKWTNKPLVMGHAQPYR